MRAGLVIGWVYWGLLGCSGGGVSALVPMEAGATATSGEERAYGE